MSFTHLIVGSNNRDNEEMLHYRNTHSVMFIVPGFSHIAFDYNKFPPLKIKTKTQLFVLKKHIKSSVKNNIKRIVKEYKFESELEKEIDLNLKVTDQNLKNSKITETKK